MKRSSPMVLALGLAVFSADATVLLPPITEVQACARADVVGRAKVLAIDPLMENAVTERWASIISIEVLTQGVSAKAMATVLWDQRLADATLAPKSFDSQVR